MVEYLPEDLQPMAKYSQEIDSADDSGKTLVQRDFVEVLKASCHALHVLKTYALHFIEFCM